MESGLPFSTYIPLHSANGALWLPVVCQPGLLALMGTAVSGLNIFAPGHKSTIPDILISIGSACNTLIPDGVNSSEGSIFTTIFSSAPQLSAATHSGPGAGQAVRIN